MRSVIEYETKAGEFDALADRATDPVLRRRYTDLAAGYRLLAANRHDRIPASQPAEQEKKTPP